MHSQRCEKFATGFDASVVHCGLDCGVEDRRCTPDSDVGVEPARGDARAVWVDVHGEDGEPFRGLFVFA